MSPKSARRFIHPRYWGIWFGVGLFYLFSRLPLNWRYRLGAVLGSWLFHLAKGRRNLVLANLRIAFPSQTPAERLALAKQHFRSLGIQFAEMSITWWGHHRQNFKQAKERQMVTFVGLEHLQNANLDQCGAIMLTPHFTHIEMTSLFFSFLYPLHPIYRPHDNPLMDKLIYDSRHFQHQQGGQPIAHTDTRQMIKRLRQGEKLGYLPDQRYRGPGHIEIPFFGRLAKSHTATSKLAKLSGCPVIPTFTRRNGMHYEVHFLPALTDFPSGDDYADTLRLHQLYEAEIRANPSQYLWVHNRWDLTKEEIKQLAQDNTA